MAKPPPAHPGFYIPNAADVPNPRMAEPDAIDFSTLAHPLWGVIEGCQVTVNGFNAATPGGVCLVNGQLVTLRQSNVSLGTGSTQDRFYLIAADAAGSLIAIAGDFAVDPVFPDPPADATVLAAVYSPAGESSSLSANVIDKRKFVNKALLTKIGTSEALVRNLHGPAAPGEILRTGSNHFLINGDGRQTWESDTWMWRDAPASLRIHRHLRVEGTLTVDGSLNVAGDIMAGGTITGSNLQQATAPPQAPQIPASIWQNPDTGKIYVWQDGAWQELATIRSANPPGTIITSFEIPSVMKPLGWLPLDGSEHSEADVPTIFNIEGLKARIIDNGPDRPRSIRLPDARRRVLITSFDTVAGSMGGAPDNHVTLAATNLPPHGHNPRTENGGGANPKGVIHRSGAHGHGIGTDGEHGHETVDPGHGHHGSEVFNSRIIAEVWGGQNKIDALFNDRNHTSSVEPIEWTANAQTGIRVGSGGSKHTHTIDGAGDHKHDMTIDPIPAHGHKVNEDLVGNGTPFDITPQYMTVYTYVRS